MAVLSLTRFKNCNDVGMLELMRNLAALEFVGIKTYLSTSSIFFTVDKGLRVGAN